MRFRMPIEPDPLPLREALRALRHIVHRGGRTVRETIGPGVLPAPAADVAVALLDEARHAARTMESAVSDVAKSVIGPRAEPALSLDRIGDVPDAERRLAASTYSALGAILARLGVTSAFVSEAAARQVYAAVAARTPVRTGADLAGDLMLALLDARIIRGIGPGAAAGPGGASPEAVAVFALLLWMQADRSDADDEAALDSATDLSAALAAEISAAVVLRDRQRLANLQAKYASHV